MQCYFVRLLKLVCEDDFFCLGHYKFYIYFSSTSLSLISSSLLLFLIFVLISFLFSNLVSIITSTKPAANGFTLRTPESRSRLIHMLSPPFVLACWLAHKNLLGQIEWKLTWWSAIRANRRKLGGDEQDGLLPHTGNGTNSRFNWNL